jgi:hypothetical protein
MSLPLNLAQLFWAGMNDDREKHQAGEITKLGNLRAGDSGAMTKAGDVVGGCHRRAYIRSFNGIEVDPPSSDRLIMFELGKANEVIWLDKLKRTWPGLLKQEEEIPIKWATSNGVNVTGRPDTVLCHADGKPVLGIEHKAVCSLWTAREVSFELTPQMKHLLQAAHYSWKLNVPYRLVYTQYTDFTMPEWSKKFFPPGHPLVEVNEKNEPKKVLPHITIFEIGFSPDGTIRYRLEGQSSSHSSQDTVYPASGWTNTVLTRDDIERYYEFISEMGTKKALGPRPSPWKPSGKNKGYKDCDYCPLADICDKYENKWEKWHDEIKARYTK